MTAAVDMTPTLTIIKSEKADGKFVFSFITQISIQLFLSFLVFSLAHQNKASRRARLKLVSKLATVSDTQSSRAHAQAMLSTARARCAYQLFISFQCGGAALCTVWERASPRNLSASSNYDNNATVKCACMQMLQ